MNVTQTCREINELGPKAQMAIKLLFQECYKAGITNIFVTETYRSVDRQKYLYAQGRSRPGKVVTWTLKSNHTNRMAWDIAVSPPASLYDIKVLTKVGEIAKKLGITWGGSWLKNIDRPHFEINANWSLPKGYVLEGIVGIPINSKDKVTLKRNDKVKKKYELVEDKDSKVWRIQSGTFKSKEAAIVAFEKTGLAYATIRGSIK